MYRVRQYGKPVPTDSPCLRAFSLNWIMHSGQVSGTVYCKNHASSAWALTCDCTKNLDWSELGTTVKVHRARKRARDPRPPLQSCRHNLEYTISYAIRTTGSSYVACRAIFSGNLRGHNGAQVHHLSVGPVKTLRNGRVAASTSLCTPSISTIFMPRFLVYTQLR
jgi:hypothetical protein